MSSLCSLFHQRQVVPWGMTSGAFWKYSWESPLSFVWRISAPKTSPLGAALHNLLGMMLSAWVLFHFPIYLHHISCSLKLAPKRHVGAALTSVLSHAVTCGFCCIGWATEISDFFFFLKITKTPGFRNLLWNLMSSRWLRALCKHPSSPYQGITTSCCSTSHRR